MKWQIVLKTTFTMVVMGMAVLGCGRNTLKSRDTENASMEMGDGHQNPTNDREQKHLSANQALEQAPSTRDRNGIEDEEAQMPTSMPYYCDPLRYPPNIINNITACKPFVGLASPSYYSSGPIGYRMRWDLLYPGYRYYGNDDHRRHGSWRNHHHRFDGKTTKLFNGSRRSSGRP